MTVRVRPLERGDGAVWQGLYAAVAGEGQWIGAEEPVDDRSDQIERDYVGSAVRACFLADVDDETVAWLTVDERDGDGAELGMAVLEGHRRQGIGTALLDAALGWAEDHGSARLVLDVFPHNEAAIALYRGFGFVEVDRLVAAWPRRNGDRWDLIVMERPVP